MKVRKYPQSHLVITDGPNKIVIDPGVITFKVGHKAKEFSDAQAYLFTHTHPDHLDPENVKAVVGDKPSFGNADVVKTLKGMGIDATEVKDQEKFQAGGFEVRAVDLEHCAMDDGSPVPPNTGFIINGVLFHPGDGDQAPEGVKSENLALPIAGPTITLDGALQFAQDVEAKVVIPIHNDYFKNDPQEFSKMASEHNIEVRILEAGEETSI